MYLFWSCILVHILYSRLSYKCFGASLCFWVSVDYGWMDSLLVAPFCSLLLHFRFLQLDLLDSALNAWNLVDLVKSLQRDSKYLHINDSVVGCWNAVESVWMSVLSSIIKSWKYYAHLKYESVLLQWMQNLPSMFNRYGILYKLDRAALCGVESLPSKTENDKIQDLSIGPNYNISQTWISLNHVDFP